jgi:hypothetical protein
MDDISPHGVLIVYDQNAAMRRAPHFHRVA